MPDDIFNSMATKEFYLLAILITQSFFRKHQTRYNSHGHANDVGKNSLNIASLSWSWSRSSLSSIFQDLYYMLWFSSSLSSIIKTFAKSCGAHPNHHCLPTFTTCTICCGAVACEVVGELKLGQFYPSVHVQRHLVRLINDQWSVSWWRWCWSWG